ncbi:HvfC/BufC N-terminal domain-containing protein [Pseudomonas sp. EL_65y_Pfl2_R95]|uniref:HvfC/BufC N-terminal domain-containing protein n=1 Tax=Pseudomonas sp. EL_65y_Pfl2_R95 TaxID=3088698 RepID=UPI0030D7F182
MGYQSEFSRALLNGQQPCSARLKTWNGSDSSSRFAVYRNNVVSSLINALADNFPVIVQLVGDDFFRAMATVFVREFPPQTRILSYYGAGFARFIEAFPPAQSLPYLADVARLEFARIQAYHSADVAGLGAEQIAQALANPEALVQMTFSLHPSLTVLNSAYGIVSLWGAHQGHIEIERVNPSNAENALILRNQLDVEVMQISAAAALFIGALMDRKTLAAAAEYATDLQPDFDLTPYLAHLIQTGVISSYSVSNSAA